MNDDKSKAFGPRRSAADAINEVRLGAARKRLAESRDQEDAIEGLREIAANFLGSEEIGLFKIDRRTATLHALWSFGIDLEKCDPLLALGHSGFQRVMSGECQVEFVGRERSDTVAKAQAFVPIRQANQTIAILAIFRLLPQKLAFDRSDTELLKLLSEEAAQALFGVNAHLKPVIEAPGMGI
jgi:GAF domain-containing protein